MAKANKTLHFLQRNVQISCPRLKTTAYQTLVRTTLEYAIHKIEMVQRRAARYILHRYHNRSSVMLQHLYWLLLEVRRQHQGLAMPYKIHHGMVAVNKDQYLTQAARTSRHAHHSSYFINEATTDYIRLHERIILLRTVKEWNSLPATEVDAPSLESFKACLVRGNVEWSTKMTKFLVALCTCTFTPVIFSFSFLLCPENDPPTPPSPHTHIHWQSLETVVVVIKLEEKNHLA